MKKVMIVDDSALMRRVISDIIEADEHLTVVATANNGEAAMELLMKGKKVDIILVDINMPKMNGVQFLRELNKNHFKIPTLIVSSIASKSANETMEALELGAFDFVKKPSGSVGQVFKDFQNEVLLRTYYACGIETSDVEQEKESPVSVVQRERSMLPVAASKSMKTRVGSRLTVIASSTGGPKALQSVIPFFPADYPYPIVVVQHMPKGFTASLATRLNELSPLTVKEAEDGDQLKKGYVYIAKGGQQCELVQKKAGEYFLSINDKPPRGGLKPCADIFFESLVNSSFEEIHCGVLTGMGSDGSKGIQQLKEHKKVKVVAQNEDTCVVYGMPRAAKVAGLVDYMVPLEDVAGTIIIQ